MTGRRAVALVAHPFCRRGFVRRTGAIWLGLIVSVGAAIPPATPRPIPLLPEPPAVFAGDPCSSHAGEFPMLTGHLSNSSGTMLARSTSGDVYGRVTNVDQRWQPSPGCGWYRYDAVIWATTSDTTHLTVDWGALSGDQLYCNYVLGTTDYLHANSGACPPATTARLVVTLSGDGNYHNDVALDNAHNFAFAHSDCDTWYGIEPIKTGASTGTTSGKPGSNCGLKQLDGTGTTQTLVVDGTAPAISFTAPAAGGPVVVSAAFYSVTFSATDAVAGFAGANGWSLQRQVATWSGSACGAFANDTGADALVTGITTGNQVSSQSLALNTCYRWTLAATDLNGNTAATITSGSIRTDTAGVLGDQPGFRTEGFDLGGGDALSVSTGSGNLRLEHPIVSLPIRAGTLDLGLAYNSHDGTNVGVGPGWRLNVQRRLAVDSVTGDVTFTDADGARHKFACSQPCSPTTPVYTRPATLYATLTRDTAATPDGFTLTYRDLSKDVFDEDITNVGLLKQVVDRFGNTVSVAYTAGTDRISTITDPASRSISVGWTGGNLTSIVDWANVSGGVVQTTGAGNRTHRLFYDGSNYLIGWADPLNTSGSCPTGGSHLTCLAYTGGFLTGISKTQTYETISANPGSLSSATRSITTNIAYTRADVASLTDAEGATTTFSHPNALPAGQTKVVRPGTPASETTYTLLSMTDAYGRTGSVKRKLGAAQIETLTSYDATYPIEPASVTEDNGGSLQRTTNYTYQAGSLGLLSRLDEPLDGTYRRYTDYTYNPNGDLARKLVYSTDAATDQTDTRYCHSTSTCATSATELVVYQSFENYVDGVDGGATGNVEDVRTRFQYDAYGQRTRSTRANYAPGGALLDSAATGWTYDTYGNLTSEIRNYANGTVTSPGDDVTPNATTNARTDLTTSYSYDTAGNRVSSADPRRAIKAAQSVTLAADDYVSRTTYDALNQAVVNRLPTALDLAGQADCSPAPACRESTTTYDELGLVREAADINHLVTATRYDKAGRALETYESVSYPSASVTSINTYDAQGRVLTAKDREQAKTGATTGCTLHAYDELGRETDVTEGSNASPCSNTTGAASTTHTFFDNLNRATCVEAAWTGTGTCIATDAGQWTKTTYDTGGRATKVDDEFTCATTAYDYRDLATQTVQGLATATCTGGTPVTTTITNDGLGRVTLRSVDVNNTPENNAYDAAGNRLSTTGKQGGVSTTSTYTVNPLDQIIVETRTDGSTAKSNYDPAGNGTDRCYWKPSITVGSCLPADTGSWTNPPTQAGTSGYDGRNERIELKTRLGSSSTVSTTTYDPAHNYQISAFYLPTAAGKEAQDLYGYDTRHRPASILHQLCTISSGHSCSSTSPTGKSTYSYDDNDNRTQVAESSVDWNLATRNYCYDPLNRLVADKLAASCATPASADNVYTFDAAGNRLSAGAPTGVPVHGSRTFTYNSVDGQLDACSNPACTVTYYDDGRTKLLTDNGTSWFFVYDADGRLISACKSTACSGSIDRVDYLYDGSGHRTQIKETTSGGTVTTTDLRYEGDTVVQELTGGTVSRTYATDDTGRIVEVCDPDCATGTIYVVVYNGHGDATGLWKQETSGTLTVANSYTYGTWGTPTTTVAPGFSDLKFRFLYVGASDVQWDASFGLGLLYMHARHYSPALGRFLQPDPSAAEDNLYAYTGNNPTTITDPSGRIALPIAVAMCLTDPPCAAAMGGALMAGWSFFVSAVRGGRIQPRVGWCLIFCGVPLALSRQDKRLTPGDIKVLKRNGIDPEELKGGKRTGQWDLWKKPNGDVVIKPRNGSGPGEPTGVNLGRLIFGHTVVAPLWRRWGW